MNISNGGNGCLVRALEVECAFKPSIQKRGSMRAIALFILLRVGKCHTDRRPVIEPDVDGEVEPDHGQDGQHELQGD